MTTGEIVAGYNALWAGTAFLFWAYLLYRIVANGLLSREALMWLAGASMMAFNEWVHRAYWVVAVWGATSNSTYADWAADYRGYLVLAIVVGVAGKLIILPALDHRFASSKTLKIMALVAVALFAVGVIGAPTEPPE